jgi:hypothetical protein
MLRILMNMSHVIFPFLALILAIFPAMGAVGECEEDSSTLLLSRHQKIENLDQLLFAFTRGFTPNLNNPIERNAFEIYRKMRFGNPTTSVGRDKLDKIASITKLYPKLSKNPFRNYNVLPQRPHYKVSDDLKKFIDSHVKGSAKVRSNLFQIEANRGYWKKLLGFDGEDNILFERFLDQHLSIELREFVRSSKNPIKGRIKVLYNFLKTVRARNPKGVDQAIVDLIHTFGYHFSQVMGDLKSNNALLRVEAFQKLLKLRENLNNILGFEGSFTEMMKSREISFPTGVANDENLSEIINKYDTNMIQAGPDIRVTSNRVRIRHLSLVESALRSCIGGTDCSTQTYMSKALDPNYHYFTQTDSTGHSSGHMTIVLGEAFVLGKKQKVAFLDKVQNVDTNDIPPMLEAIRQSLNEQDYLLAMPEKMGNDNGLSNEAFIRNFMRERILPKHVLTAENFKPHQHEYDFQNEYSRAEAGLSLRIFGRLKEVRSENLSPGEIIAPWRTDDFNLEKMVSDSFSLKDGNLEEKMRYIPSMQAIKQARLPMDDQFEETIEKWFKDPSTHFKLKKQIFIYYWLEKRMSIQDDGLLMHFSQSEKFNIIQNILSTPRFKELLLKDDTVAPFLLLEIRNSEKIVDQLLKLFFPNKIKPFKKLLKATTLSNDQLIELMIELNRYYHSSDLNELGLLLKSLKNDPLYDEFKLTLIQNFLNRSHGKDIHLRALSLSLTSKNKAVQDLSKELAQKTDTLPIFLSNKNTQEWLNSSKTTPAERAEFLRAVIGTETEAFEEYIKILNKEEQIEVLNILNEEGLFPLFRKIKTFTRTPSEVFDKALMESFQFKTVEKLEGHPLSVKFGKKKNFEWSFEKPFEIQVTPVTQLQWSMLMKTNPSRVGTRTRIELKLADRAVWIEPNTPVGNISWEEIQLFIRELNERQKDYTYRLPSEGEWTYASQTYANDPLLKQAWLFDNSKGQFMPVARLAPNRYGLYDMYGNVEEWADLVAREKLLQVDLDPYDLPLDFEKPVLGGSSITNYEPLSEGRYGQYMDKLVTSPTIGFRLVREKREN